MLAISIYFCYDSERLIPWRITVILDNNISLLWRYVTMIIPR